MIPTAINNTPLSGTPFHPINFVAWILVGLVITPLMAGAHYFMNRMLTREKSQELRLLQEELSEASALPNDAEAVEVLRRMHRMQLLLYQIQKVETFVPTLADSRFLVQISLSTTAIVLANVVIRTAIEGFL